MVGSRWEHREHVPPPNQWPTEVVRSGRVLLALPARFQNALKHSENSLKLRM